MLKVFVAAIIGETTMSVQQRARLRHQRDIDGHPFDGGVLQWLVDRELGAEHVMAYRLTVVPDSTASHAHPGAEEVLYVLEGSGEIRVEDASHLVGPGQAVFVPDGADHSYVNTGEIPLVVVGAMAPPIDPALIRPAVSRLNLTGLPSSSVEEGAVGPTMMDERRVTPTLMGERSFRVLVNPAVGCRLMTQFTGVIPTGKAPLHAHPHEEAVYILAGTGRLWIENDPVGELHPGSVVFFPIGVRHTLENTGAEDMKVLGAFSPAGSPEAKLAPAR
ncbi:MAG TPA: cupin domain-containing protein [Candidatus Dormibacteraeota bacterium]|nr:cupin domain-containing protein [Candidatus Dormibacteraeota bacterium]